MNPTTLEDRLTDLGRHLDEECEARGDQLTSSVAGPPARPTEATGEIRAGFRPAILAVAAVVVLAAAGAAWLNLAPNEATVEAADAGPPPPAAVPADAPAPGSVSPFLEEPPDWFGEPSAGRRPADHFQGRWTSLAIGLTDDQGSIRSPIVVSVTDGSVRELDDVPPAVFGDRELRLQTGPNDWALLATTDEPTLVVSGPADIDLLLDVLESVSLRDDGGSLGLQLAELPDGYSTIVDQQIRAADIAERRTLVSADGLTVVNEVSEWVRADLAAAASGVDHETVPVGATTGYAGDFVSSHFGPMIFLTWSPAPGVVLEIGTADPSVELSQLVELASEVTLLPVDEWDDRLAG